MKPIQGSTKQCVAHLGKILKSDPDYYEKRRAMAAFLHLDDQTLHRWFKHGPVLIGESNLRVQYYLEFLGYGVKELQKMQPLFRDAGRLIAFDLISIGEMADYVGFECAPGSRSRTLFMVFRGARGTSPEKLERFAELVVKHTPALAARQKATEKPVQFESVVLETAVAAPEKPTLSETGTSAVIQSFAQSVAALVPLAELMVSDRYSAEDREQIRHLAGGNVSRLSRLLTQLSGEAARNALAEPATGGGTK